MQHLYKMNIVSFRSTCHINAVCWPSQNFQTKIHLKFVNGNLHVHAISLTLYKMTFLIIKAKSEVRLSRGIHLLESVCPNHIHCSQRYSSVAGQERLTQRVNTLPAVWLKLKVIVLISCPGALWFLLIEGELTDALLVQSSHCVVFGIKFYPVTNWTAMQKWHAVSAKESQRTRSVQKTQTDEIPCKGTKITTKKRYKFVLL